MSDHMCAVTPAADDMEAAVCRHAAGFGFIGVPVFVFVVLVKGSRMSSVVRKSQGMR